MKRPASLSRSTPLRSTGAPERRTEMPRKNVKRKASEFSRCYGSKARVAWIKQRPCAACGVVGYSENAHVCGNDGAGRKGPSTTIAPLCGPRPLARSVVIAPGCHRLYDEQRYVFTVFHPAFDPVRAAAETEQAWLASVAGTATTGSDA